MRCLYVADSFMEPSCTLSSMVTKTVISRDIFYMDCFGLSVFMELTMLVMLVGAGLAPRLVSCKALPHVRQVVAASPWWAWS